MDLKKVMLNNEKHFSEYACKDKDAIRIYGNLSDDIRPNYFRDIDRIIYSLSYTRYIDKTQVFSNKQNDHISKRIIHVQLVSKIARTIGRALSLNEDLIEAQALGHDIGHVPFGHLGEKILDDISMRYDNCHFMHNVQSVRNLMVLENNGKGMNLTVQTLDGILCHNGEFVQDNYAPKPKTKEEFLSDYEKCYVDPEHAKNLVPMTLEGCVVRISDIIGYLGRDIEDAVRLGVFDIKEIPESIQSILGNNNRDIISTITTDIINNSIGKNYIKMSPKIYNAVKDLKKFNYAHIYNLANTDEEIKRIYHMFNKLFEYLYKSVENEEKDKRIFTIYLDVMDKEYLESTNTARKVIDYISGMTDEYFTDEFNLYEKASQ